MSRILDSAIGAERRAACERNDMLMSASMRTVTRAARMVTTPAGITIGIAHSPAPPVLGSHAEALQSALLTPETARPFPFWRRLIGAVWRIL